MCVFCHLFLKIPILNHDRGVWQYRSVMSQGNDILSRHRESNCTYGIASQLHSVNYLFFLQKDKYSMYLAALALLSGVTTIQWFTKLPSFLWCFPVLLFALLGWCIFPKRFKFLAQFLFFMCLGCGYAIFRAQEILSWQLPVELENINVTITGVIVSLPKIT